MHTSPIKPGERRKVITLGRSEAVRILDSARGHPRHWLCKSELRGEILAVPDYELGELIPGGPTAAGR